MDISNYEGFVYKNASLVNNDCQESINNCYFFVVRTWSIWNKFLSRIGHMVCSSIINNLGVGIGYLWYFKKLEEEVIPENAREKVSVIGVFSSRKFITILLLLFGTQRVILRYYILLHVLHVHIIILFPSVV